MLLEATGKPLRYKLRSGEEFLLRQGCPVDMPDDSARALIAKAGDRVRVVAPEPVSICPAADNPKPIYWERAGSIVGPGRPEFLAKVGDGLKATYWVVVQYQGQPGWINSDLIRSKRSFEQQIPLKRVELVREPR